MSKSSKNATPVPQACEGNIDASNTISGKRPRTNSDTQNNKKRPKLDDGPDKLNSDVIKNDKMSDSTATEKRANFSALTPNLVRIPSINLKPGTTKKLVIKNFKSKFTI